MKRCPSCGETKPRATGFGRRTNGYAKSYCRVCEAAAARARYRRVGPDTEKSRRASLLRFFGLTEDAYQRMHRDHGGLCAICRQPQGARGRRLFVDHCHATGQIRGLLCSRCNTGLGMFADDPDLLTRAIAYLQRPVPDDALYVPETSERAL